MSLLNIYLPPSLWFILFLVNEFQYHVDFLLGKQEFSVQITVTYLCTPHHGHHPQTPSII